MTEETIQSTMMTEAQAAEHLDMRRDVLSGVLDEARIPSFDGADAEGLPVRLVRRADVDSFAAARSGLAGQVEFARLADFLEKQAAERFAAHYLLASTIEPTDTP